MDLNTTLKQFEAVEANLAKLDRLWAQIQELLPGQGSVVLNDPDKYLMLQRSFSQIEKGMPAIDGVKLRNLLLHPDEIVSGKIDCLELDEFGSTLAFDRALFGQGEELSDYRFRMEAKRRELARQGVEQLYTDVESTLQVLPDPPSPSVPGPNTSRKAQG